MKVIELPVVSTGDVMHNMISKNSTAVWYTLKLLKRVGPEVLITRKKTFFGYLHEVTGGY